MLPTAVLSIFLLLVAVTAASPASCPGCESVVDHNDSNLHGILVKAVAIQNAKSNAEPVTVVAINRATSQVVAGTKYTFDYTANGQRSNKRFNCHTEVLSQPWTNPEPQVLKHNCN